MPDVLELAAGAPLSVAGYREAVSGRLLQNLAGLASQGTIRHNVARLAAGARLCGRAAGA